MHETEEHKVFERRKNRNVFYLSDIKWAILCYSTKSICTFCWEEAQYGFFCSLLSKLIPHAVAITPTLKSIAQHFDGAGCCLLNIPPAFKYFYLLHSTTRKLNNNYAHTSDSLNKHIQYIHSKAILVMVMSAWCKFCSLRYCFTF